MKTPESFIVTCPRCGQDQAVTPRDFGAVLVCVSCRQDYTAPSHEAAKSSLSRRPDRVRRGPSWMSIVVPVMGLALIGGLSSVLFLFFGERASPYRHETAIIEGMRDKLSLAEVTEPLRTPVFPAGLPLSGSEDDMKRWAEQNEALTNTNENAVRAGLDARQMALVKYQNEVDARIQKAGERRKPFWILLACCVVVFVCCMIPVIRFEEAKNRAHA